MARAFARLAILAFAAALAAGAATARAASGRVALLIGNNAYTSAPLGSAVHDARDLAEALRALGFTTIVRENATRRDMLEALRDFEKVLEGADVALFFFAGHAMQFKERNFLLPIDSEMRSEDEVTFFAMEVAQVLDRLERAKTRTNIIILDACRNNPFASSFRVSVPGLAQPVAPSGTLVAYATAPGSVAGETYGRNGVYTQHLLRHVATPALPIETVFKRVREGVEKETRYRQTPWEASSLKTDIVLNAAAAPMQVAAARPNVPSVDVQLQIERDFWLSVSASNRREELQAYLDNYPEGRFVAIARLRLEQMPAEPYRQKTRGFTWPAATTAAAGAAPQPAPLPLEALFRPPAYADMQLAPDGLHVAALAPVRGRQNLVVVELARRTARALTTLEGRDVVWFRWVNARRILFRTGSVSEGGGPGGGLFALDIDGGSPRQLSAGSGEGARLASARWMEFVRAFPGGSDDVVVQEAGSVEGPVIAGALLRINTRTGRRAPIGLGKPDGGEREQWLVDRDGVARVLSAQRRGRTAIHYRADAGSPWIALDEFDRATPGWEPLAIAEDGRSLLARSWRGRDKAAIVRVEPRPGATETVVASHPYVDVGGLILDADRAAGIAYDADRPGFAWMDEEMERIQRAVNEALPRATNTLSWSENRERVLVLSDSDVSPGTYYFFDRTTGRLEYFADRAPWLSGAALLPSRPVRYRARDGLEIPAYLTLPRGEPTRRPLVVLVHSGPWTEGAGWRFDAQAQFLASRGYAVLQPNYRGTLRYGWRHFRASFRQFGGAMHDDLVDGVAWAIERGHADPERVCVAGSGYGGYASLMALVRSPGTFRCAIDHGGPTDLVRLLTGEWQQGALPDALRYDVREMVGDPERDRAALADASPLAQAERIRGAVLIAHGSEDRTVPREHSDRLRSALEAAGRPPQWLALAGEGRDLTATANATRFYEAVEQFLATHLKP